MLHLPNSLNFVSWTITSTIFTIWPFAENFSELCSQQLGMLLTGNAKQGTMGLELSFGIFFFNHYEDSVEDGMEWTENGDKRPQFSLSSFHPTVLGIE